MVLLLALGMLLAGCGAESAREPEFRILVFSSCTEEAACGLSTSTPVSSTNVVVTMKKINRINTQSISGEISIPVSSVRGNVGGT